MDKTISISLGGFSFIVDDHAYFKLKSYLDEIRNSLQGMEGTDDILADVETRIAELFKEKLGQREVVNVNDVENIIQIMGRPEQYMDSDEAEMSSNERNYNYSNNEKITKKLYRDPDDKIIAGVLSGISHYIGIEPWMMRLIWIVLFFADTIVSFTTITVVGYIVMWIILPKAETTTQKFEMFGQVGNFETIKKNISQAATEGVGKASSTFNRLLRIFAKLAMIFVGIILIISGISMIVGAISILVASVSGIPVEFFGYIFDYDWQYTLAVIFAFLLFFIPSLVILLLGARLISSRVKINKTFILASLAIWMVTIVASIIFAISFSRNFMHDIEYNDKKSYQVQADTIELNFNEFKQTGKYKYKWFSNGMSDLIEFDGGVHKKIHNDIYVVPSENDQLTVEVTYKAQGKNLDNARDNAEMIDYKYTVKANGNIEFNRFLTLPKGSKYRDQRVRITVHVPKNIVVKTSNVDDVILYDKSNDTYDYQDGNEKFFKFVNDNFQCLNCESDREKHIEDFDDLDGIEIIDTTGEARVKIDRNGLKVESGKEKVSIKKNQIKVTDGTDSIKLSLSSN